MPSTTIVTETDATLRSISAILTGRFAARALLLMRSGRDPYQAARLCASYAMQAHPHLRVESLADRHARLRADQFSASIFRLGRDLNLAAAGQWGVH